MRMQTTRPYAPSDLRVLRTACLGVIRGSLLALCAAWLPASAWALTLVEDGQPQAVIVTAEQPSETVRLAVDELNGWMHKITGTELPVVPASQWDGQRVYIAVGPSDLTRQRGIGVDHLGPEGARVVIDEAGVVLIGRDEPPLEELNWYGSYYATLEFVKQELGVRWIWPGELGEVYRQSPTLAVEARAWQWETPLVFRREMRNTYSPGSKKLREQRIGHPIPDAPWEAASEAQSQWLMRQRMNKPSLVHFGHAFTDWWDRYGESHPEWFAKPPKGVVQRGGPGVTLCVSTPAVAEAAFREWHEKWQDAPEAWKTLRASPNDSRLFCTCPTCRAWDGPAMADASPRDLWNRDAVVVTERYVRFWNAIAEKVAAVDPEAWVTTYAYRNYRQPPVYNKLQPNVVVGYVGGEGFYPDEPHLREEWRGWAEAGARLFWRPNLLHCGHGGPYIFARQLGEDFKYFFNHNMIGTDFDSLVGAWATQGPNYYVVAELHSRPDASVDDLLQEYYGAFGDAAPQVQAYFEYWEQVTQRGPRIMREENLVNRLTWGGWWEGFISLTPRLYTPQVLAKAEALLNEADRRVAEADAVYRHRVAFLRAGLDHTRLTAEAFEQFEQFRADAPGADRDKAVQALQRLRDMRRQLQDSIAVPVYYLTALEENKTHIWSELGVAPF